MNADVAHARAALANADTLPQAAVLTDHQSVAARGLLDLAGPGSPSSRSGRAGDHLAEAVLLARQHGCLIDAEVLDLLRMAVGVSSDHRTSTTPPASGPQSSSWLARTCRAVVDAAHTGDEVGIVSAIAEFELRGLVSCAEMARHATAGALTRRRRRTPGRLPALAPRDADPLTPRERETADLAGRRLSSAEIADRLGVSVRTVDNHLGAVYRALGITSRRELIAMAESEDIVR
ncbi:helix-turn-helix transcriptional regulator [Gordonia soli]|nr:helix-turn-helix transcriptional regulator [Gordonia soli]